jgi:release factor glutamine methyltransferase
MARPPQSLGQVLRAATGYLAERDVYQAKQACELLVGCLLGCKPLELYVRFDQQMTDKQLAAMRRGIKRLAQGEPVQYIVGTVDFAGRSFKVDPRALIPRPETEVLVNAVLGTAELWNAGPPSIADIGTGSGCIITTLALESPEASYMAFDVTIEALALAAENAAMHQVLDRITFSGPDLSEMCEPDSLDAIVANLPYVSTGEWEALPIHIRSHEPRSALDGGADGLAILRDVVPDAWILLKDGGWLFLEIGESQGESTLQMLEQNGFSGARIVQDLADKDRVVVAVKAEA